MDLKVSFLSVEKEAAQKLHDLVTVPVEVERGFLEDARRRLSPEDYSRVLGSIDVCRRLPASGTYQHIDKYFSHPLRVAGYFTRFTEARAVDGILICILHNLYEVTGKDRETLAAAGVELVIADAVRLLTIDRSLENDVAYLAEFYGRIEAHSPELSLVRVLDKLDNLLGIGVLEDGPVKTSYIDLAERFVLPMASRLSPDLAAYFAEVVRVMRARPCDVKYMELYKRFMES